MKFIPVECLSDFLNGKMDLSNDPMEHYGHYFQQTMAAVRTGEETLPYWVGTFYYEEGCGLYIIAAYQSKNEKCLMEKLLTALSYTGIGGKKSGGLGKFQYDEKQIPGKLLESLQKKSDRYMLLSVALPADEELENALENASYLLEIRSGFVASSDYAEEWRKKRDLYVFTAGSCFVNCFDGDIYDVSEGGKHPVYRYAKPIFMGGIIMRDYLKHYRVKICVLSPVYIGSGEKIGKKEHIYMPWNHHVIIPNVEKMYMDLQKKGLGKEFADYMMDGRPKGPSLSQWLGQHKMQREDYERWKLYEMDAGEAFVSQTARPKEIEAFVKDAYGMPYVPGSTLKGMFRTALIADEIQKCPEKYERIGREIQSASAERVNRKQCLARETKRLEQQIFYTLKRDEKKPANAVNDNLSGLHVGDSQPISVDQLTLSQKIDVTLDGTEKPLNVLRETLIPGTEICFDVSIDTTICPYEMEDIIEALNIFQNICNRYFYARFRREAKEENTVWLGGGCGFLSKTVLYPLLGSNAVKVVDNVFKNTLGKNYVVHKHTKDLQLKLAPHVCKCTKYQGKLYHMGMGRIEFEKI